MVDLGGATITSSTTGLADGNWHHLAVSFPSAANSGAAKLYVDGTGTNGSGTTTINTNPPRMILDRAGRNQWQATSTGRSMMCASTTGK